MAFLIIIILLIFTVLYTIISIKNDISSQGKRNTANTIIIPMKGHKENAEFILRKAAFKSKWKSFNRNLNIICLDCGMDSETRKICSLVCRDYDFMKLEDSKVLKDKNSY